MKIENLFNVLERMQSINRHHSFKTISTESLLEHTAFVSIICFFLGEKIQENYKINMELLLKKSILHDIEEIETGDIPTTTKHFNADIEEVLKDIANIKINKIEDDLELRTLKSVWSVSKIGKEGCIVALADALSIVFLMWMEYNMGNSFIKNVGANLIEYLESINEKVFYLFDDKIFLIKLIKDSQEIVRKIRNGN